LAMSSTATPARQHTATTLPITTTTVRPVRRRRGGPTTIGAGAYSSDASNGGQNGSTGGVIS
jgi:hypothetical protein